MSAVLFLLFAVMILAPRQTAAQIFTPEAGFSSPQERSGTNRITGSVTGTVFFADTQRPARFASVQLYRVTAEGEGRVRVGGPAGRTTLDGTFLLENIEAGDYYLSASATGYVSPSAEAQAAVAAGAAEADAMRRMPVVHVGAGAPASATLTLERGAVLAGTVTWDDGSPAAGVQVSVVNATSPTNVGGRGLGGFGGGFGRFFGGTVDTTDDRGHFRLTGVVPGEYYVRASVQAPLGGGSVGRGGFSRIVPLVTYAPGKLRRSDAQSFKLHGAEERDDVAITMDVRALHNVSGRVSVGSGSAVSGGQVRLVDSTDNSLSRFAEIAADGSFDVPYVPAGTYTLTVNARTGGSSSGGAGGGTFTPGQSLQPLQQTLAVADGDVSGLSLTVTPTATAAAR